MERSSNCERTVREKLPGLYEDYLCRGLPALDIFSSQSETEACFVRVWMWARAHQLLLQTSPSLSFSLFDRQTLRDSWVSAWQKSVVHYIAFSRSSTLENNKTNVSNNLEFTFHTFKVHLILFHYIYKYYALCKHVSRLKKMVHNTFIAINSSNFLYKMRAEVLKWFCFRTHTLQWKSSRGSTQHQHI